MVDEFDLEAFRLADSETVPAVKVPTMDRGKRSTAPFIRGPIPLAWIGRAAQIPRKSALIVGLVIWFVAGLSRQRTGLVLSVKRCETFGLGRRAVRSGLIDLESAGLVRVDRSNGRSPRVDLIDLSIGSEG